MKQELEKHSNDLTPDIQFQFTLLAETLDQESMQQTNRHFHLLEYHYRAGEPIQPPWETLPYMRRTRSQEAYWNRQIRQDRFWRNIWMHRREDQPEADDAMPPLQDVND